MTAIASFAGRRILIGVCGGIAAYKLCEVASQLAQAGAEVRVILTSGAEKFVSPLTFSNLCRHPAYTDADFWSARHGRPLHIELGEWAEVMLMAPLTANTLAKLRYGQADNLLTNTVLATTAPLLLAPAMNTDMWLQPVVQENWQALRSRPQVLGLEPASGRLACDRVGSGRLPEPIAILAALESLLWTQGKADLQGLKILVNAGGTREFLDPVRFIGNPSSGRMGVMLAIAAQHRGAQVQLIHAPLTNIEPGLLTSLDRQAVVSTEELAEAMTVAAPSADWVLLAAAVGDVRPELRSHQKLSKAELPASLPLQLLPDIAAQLSQQRHPNQKLIGFAAQTGEILEPAIAKLRRKGLDAIIANAVDQPGQGFGSTTNAAIALRPDGSSQSLGFRSKLSLAHAILDFVKNL
ncbi:bifunctional phosphopantothenoylcysteine decarboxylase/phosphopantothenate--cysteine ligase CoaBC [Synechococcus elongatus IITB7]|uniref:bifunctional phosphopantothenoylcysteine decarboxylase/phosphopantothenate--cysteine ligase CoaBC n=1 Tax=Synechococcus elongatus TaxID=32046 RepID=UPI0030CDAA69